MQDVVDDSGNKIYKVNQVLSMEADEFIEEIIPDIMDCYEDTSAFKACLKTNLCPKSLMNEEISELINMKVFVRIIIYNL